MLETISQLFWVSSFQLGILVFFELYGMLIPQAVLDVVTTKRSFAVFIIVRIFPFLHSFGAGVTFTAPEFPKAIVSGANNASVFVTRGDVQAELSLVLISEWVRRLVEGKHCATIQYLYGYVTIR